MAMNRQRRTANISNIFSYDDAGNIVIKDYSQVIRYSWNGTIHGFVGQLSVSSVSAAVTDTDKFLVSDGGVLKFRTGAEVLADIGGQPLLTNPVTGTGVAGQVAYWSGTNSQTGSNNLFWDAANSRLGIGTNAPAESMQIVGGNLLLDNNRSFRTKTTGGSALEIIKLDTSNSLLLGTVFAGGQFISYTSTSFRWFQYPSSVTTERMQLTSAGNLILQNGGAFSDGGQRLQVQGTGYFSDSVGIGSTSLTGYGLRVSKTITGSSASYGITSEGIVQSGVTSEANYFHTSAQTAAGSYTTTFLRHFSANQSTFGAGSSVTVQIGFNAESNLIGAANNIGFYGNIPSGSGRWNLYMNGTANNYLAGSLGIGATSLTGYNLRLEKNITGSVSSHAISQVGVVQSDVTNNAFGYYNLLNTQAASFNLTNYSHFYADRLTIGAGSSITNQYGFRVATGANGATNNYAFHSNLAAATGVWNLYMAGTADNYLAGKLLIGTTTVGTYSLDVNGTARVSGTSYFGDRVGFNSTGTSNVTLRNELPISGSSSSYGYYTSSIIQSGVTNQASYFLVLPQTQASSFTLSRLSGFEVAALSIGAGSSISEASAFYGGIASGFNHWNLYMGGTANNYMAGNLLIGTTSDQGYRVQITGSGDNMLNVWGATAPSIRIDNAASGATQRFVFGLATTTNNFITGAVAGDICMTTQSSNPLLFGANALEVMRITTSRNLLINKTTDGGQKLQVSGKVNFASLPTSATGLAAGDIWNNGGVLNIV